jgi:YihY family inner membrane protein
MQAVQRTLTRADGLQRRHAALGFPVAVFKKFGEDRAGQLAALVAYYSFFSLFPLLLALVTILGMFLDESSQLRGLILDSALAQFPIIGEEIRKNVQAIEGSGLALFVGVAGALWAGLGGIKAAQNAMDQVWDVPVKHQPNFFVAIIRAVLMLLTLGVFLLLASFLGGVAAGTETQALLPKVAGVTGSVVLNILVFWVAFRVLTVAEVSWKDVLPGALIAGIAWAILQAAAGYIIGHRLESATEVYGAFAVVIGLLTWMYLGAQVTFLAAEVNVIRAKRLWPRALHPEEMTEADRRTLRALAETEERREEQEVEVRFAGESGDGPVSRSVPAASPVSLPVVAPSRRDGAAARVAKVALGTLVARSVILFVARLLRRRRVRPLAPAGRGRPLARRAGRRTPG